ncbi:MAG TPA: conjugative transposon protein TraM [Puia sp.]|nr:conjugative transposon protein TraM [Puia sp.]
MSKQKRIFLLAAPVVVIAMLFVVFYILGGGRSGKPAGAAAMGLNTQLPKPKFDLRQAFLNKMQAYVEADRDSVRKEQYERQDPYRKTDTPLLRRGVRTDAAGNKAGAPGDRGNPPGDRTTASSDRKADELLRQLDNLRKSIHQPSVSPPPGARSPADEQWVLPRSAERFATPRDTSDGDAKMEQLNRMLDKVIRIQHPEEAKAAATPPARRSTDEVMPADSSVNTISAVVPEDQTLTAGATLALRITDSIRVDGRVLAAGQLVYGTVTIQNDRMPVRIGALRDDRNLYTTELEVYDLDGLAGIHIPGVLSREVAKQSADQGVNSLNVLNMDPSLGAQAASAGIQTVKSFVGRKVRQVRVSVKAGYRVLLRPARNDLVERPVKPSGLVDRRVRPPGFVPGGPVVEHCRSEGMELSLRGVWLVDSLLWLGLEWVNHSPIPYMAAYTRWYIRDRRVLKRTAMQEWPVAPVGESAPVVVGDSLRYGWAGFRPFALAKDKELVLEMGEKGGGRVLQLVIDHRELLHAKCYGKETEP